MLHRYYFAFDVLKEESAIIKKKKENEQKKSLHHMHVQNKTEKNVVSYHFSI